MHEATNLQWPEAPFGAEQRPFGRHTDMMTAVALDWADRSDTGPLPMAAATVYLRVRRRGNAEEIRPDTLPIGFRVTVLDDPAEVPDLFAVLDRALTRARRHAAVLAGYAFGDDLARMLALSTVPLRGAAGALAGWADRTVSQRGMAVMVDTAVEASNTGAALDVAVTPPRPSTPAGPGWSAAAARAVLARCAAIGLTAAVHAGRYRWAGTFGLSDAIDRAAWDMLTPYANGAAGGDAGPPVASVARTQR